MIISLMLEVEVLQLYNKKYNMNLTQVILVSDNKKSVTLKYNSMFT